MSLSEPLAGLPEALSSAAAEAPALALSSEAPLAH